MANIKASIKDIRVSSARRERNKTVQSKLKTSLRKTRELLESGEPKEATEALSSAVSELDRAASRGIIHPNNAARRKSRLTRKLNAKVTKTE